MPAPALNFARFFRQLPQTTFSVHSFRTAAKRFPIVESLQMSESALTAGVNVTLPVIAQGWFCGSFPESGPERI
jgi:hypothetical protein